MLIDANLLLYAIDDRSPFHDAAAEWLTGVLRGDRRVGLAWTTIGAFLRITTNPRIYEQPLDSENAVRFVTDWLACEPVWMPPASPVTFRHYRTLCERSPITGNLVPDAMLAALAIEHGLTVMTADTDFNRFAGVRFADPLR